MVHGDAGPGVRLYTDRSIELRLSSWGEGGRGLDSRLEDGPTCAIFFASRGLHLPFPHHVILAWKYRRTHRRSACHKAILARQMPPPKA
jgi:hypothetical protein